MADDPALTALLDRAEIKDTLYLYCEAIDERRWDRFDEIFAESVTARFPGGTVDEGLDERVIEGRAAFVEFLRASFAHLGLTHHLMSTMRVELDGDRATFGCRVRAYHANKYYSELFEESLALFSGRMVRTDDGWRVQEFREVLPILLGTRQAFNAPDGTRG